MPWPLAAAPRFTLFRPRMRAVLVKAQSGDVAMAPAEITDQTIAGGSDDKVSLTIVRPTGTQGSLPVVVYIHGGGWILGNFATHERLVRDLATQTRAAFVFVNYTPSPEAHYPVAIEQAYAATKWVAEQCAQQ